MYSGYAYSFTHDPENIHIMRKWEGDDPGINNQKTPTILLLTPNKVAILLSIYSATLNDLETVWLPQ